ncbi:MAG TPA: hypothetical protein VFN26_03695 [Candidatus Acidoferrum sp.]|nr:hypothetical protein [Candidatus Acidoferrum sp.]
MLFLFEKFGPTIAGVLFFLANLTWVGRSVYGAEWGNRLLDRVVQVSAVGVAFWGIAITLLMGMDTKPVIGHLRRLDYYRTVIYYFEESLFASLSLLVTTALLEPLSRRFSPVAMTSVWLGAGVWALLTAVRTYAVLGSLLARASAE